jgi:tripartite-type tricarboxylate transporter receptor subunit TctC
MPRRLFAACAMLAFAIASAAQDFPTRAITIVVPFAAGGTIGVEKVAHAKPDGYTLLLMHIGIATSASLYRNLRYDAQQDLDPVGLVTDVPMTRSWAPT